MTGSTTPNTTATKTIATFSGTGGGASVPRTTGGWGEGAVGVDGKFGVGEISRHEVACQTTEELYLSHVTTAEVIPTLSHTQAVRELKYFKALRPNLKPKGGNKTPSRAAINDCLLSAVLPSVLLDFDQIGDNMSTCHQLIKSFACTAERLDKRSDEVERNIAAISELVSEYRQRRQVPPPSPSTTGNFNFDSCDTSYQSISEDHTPAALEYNFDNLEFCDVNDLLLSSNIPGIKVANTPLTCLSVEDLNKSTDFTHHMKSRVAGYYGKYPYRYPGGTHPPRDMSDNPVLDRVAAQVKSIYPQLDFNSALVQRYDNGSCTIPRTPTMRMQLTHCR